MRIRIFIQTRAFVVACHVPHGTWGVRGHARRGAAGAGGRRVGQRQPGPIRAAARGLRGGIPECRGAAGDSLDLDRLDRGGDGAVDRADVACRGGGLDADRRCRVGRALRRRRSRLRRARCSAAARRSAAAIDYAAGMLARAPYQGQRQVIDVSGDGANNRGRPAEDARDEAVQAGVSDQRPADPDAGAGPGRLLPAERDRRPGRIRDRGEQLRGVRRRRAQAS